VLESAPIERVNFMRDEMANMVWDVESTVPSRTGQGVSGYETTAQTSVPPPTLEDEDENVRIRYLGTTVPRNWIPFIPDRPSPFGSPRSESYRSRRARSQMEACITQLLTPALQEPPRDSALAKAPPAEQKEKRAQTMPKAA
jgi:hypothetical protein